MTQSGFIAAILLLGFVLYLAAKDRLSAYTAVIWGSTVGPLPTYTTSSTSGGGSSGGSNSTAGLAFFKNLINPGTGGIPTIG